MIIAPIRAGGAPHAFFTQRPDDTNTHFILLHMDLAQRNNSLIFYFLKAVVQQITIYSLEVCYKSK